ncbi:hypothetical protein BGZ58_007756 [Dissophora ornata]|nr:hypothetical protein BGZ58_007756 [Dissophora ornata]
MQSPSHHDSSHSGAAGSPEPPPLSSSSNITNVVIPNKDNNNKTTTTSAHSHTLQSTNKYRPSGSAQGKNASNGQLRAQSSSGMGDGIVNQSMKEDLENWIAAIGLARDIPIHVVGYFGQCQDLSMFERVSPPPPATGTTGSEDDDSRFDVDDERSPVYYEKSRDLAVDTEESEAGTTQGRRSSSSVWNMGVGDPQATGDIQLYVDRAKNTVMLQHAYLHDTQEMLSVCLESLDTVKKDFPDDLNK